MFVLNCIVSGHCSLKDPTPSCNARKGGIFGALAFLGLSRKIDFGKVLLAYSPLSIVLKLCIRSS